MAKRQSARAVEARQRARARTADRREREQRLEDLATGWYEAQGEIEEIESSAQEKIEKFTARVRAEAGQQVLKLRDRASEIVATMLANTGVRDVADRLGLPEAEVRQARAADKRQRGPAVTEPARPEPADHAVAIAPAHGGTMPEGSSA